MPHTISLRIPDDVYKKLKALCSDLDRNRSYLIKKAIEQYINDHIDYRMALDRLKVKDDKILSSKELRKKLGI